MCIDAVEHSDLDSLVRVLISALRCGPWFLRAIAGGFNLC